MVTRKKTASPKKSTKKAQVSRPKSKKPVAKKVTASRPKNKVIKIKGGKPKPKTQVKAKVKAKPKPKPKPKKVVLKPDTDVSCHRCGKQDKINFAYVWKNSIWPWCCGEGMHIEDSKVKIGEVMNDAWVKSGGYSGNFNLKH